jgi:hypothetical protein
MDPESSSRMVSQHLGGLLFLKIALVVRDGDWCRARSIGNAARPASDHVEQVIYRVQSPPDSISDLF